MTLPSISRNIVLIQNNNLNRNIKCFTKVSRVDLLVCMHTNVVKIPFYQKIDFLQKSEIDSSSKDGTRPPVTGNISFQDVHFRYPARQDVQV